MKFYDINGTEICKEQFVKIYGDSYFIGNKRIVNGVGQNSRYAEEEIEKVLKYGIKTPIDVVHILAWKTGKSSIMKVKRKGSLFTRKIGAMQRLPARCSVQELVNVI